MPGSDRVQELLEELSAAIHDSVQQAERVAALMDELREQGCDAVLMLEATVLMRSPRDGDDASPEGEALTPVSIEREPDAAPAADDGRTPYELPQGSPFSGGDLDFLQELRIRPV